MVNNKIMKKILVILILFLFVLASCNNKDRTNQTTVAVVFPVSIDAFDQLENGIKNNLDNTYKISIYSAEGDPDKFETAVQAGFLENPKYFVPIGTQVTNTTFGPKYLSQHKIIVCGAISSPELVESLVNVGLEPKRNSEVSIISDSPQDDIYNQLSTSVASIFGQNLKVGIIFNNSEINSKGTATKSKVALENNGFNIITGLINKSEDIEKVTQNLLLDRIDLLLIPHDKNAVTKASAIVKLCNTKNIPVISLDDGTVKKDGVAMGVSVNYYKVGQLIAETIKDIEKGKKASEIPIVYEKSAGIYINKSACSELNIDIPNDLEVTIY